ncbi:MAG TPA: PH domain-containing protein [Allosphingosinicella sp.]|nr:PH domain-containing protein [Allosphingosinicella sp.]
MGGDEQAGQTHDGAAAMQSLDPNQIKVMRIRAALVSAGALVIAFVLDLGPLRETPAPAYALSGVVLLLALYLVLVFPGRRYRAWGYGEGEDELAVRHGVLVRRHTIVPFGRVQHIDVAQGPIERRYDLATLILHTAGTRSASVSLPGLKQPDAEALRDRIRAKIRQDLV